MTCICATQMLGSWAVSTKCWWDTVECPHACLVSAMPVKFVMSLSHSGLQQRMAATDVNFVNSIRKFIEKKIPVDKCHTVICVTRSVFCYDMRMLRGHSLLEVLLYHRIQSHIGTEPQVFLLNKLYCLQPSTYLICSSYRMSKSMNVIFN